MALQSSGQITIDDLRTEFGVTGQASLSDFYRGGSNVPDTTTNSGVPTSGQIQLSDFYGTSSARFYVYLALGSSSGGGYVRKYDDQGNQIWSHDDSSKMPNCIDIDSSEDVYWAHSSGTGEFVQKRDTDNNYEWQNSAHGGPIITISVTPAGKLFDGANDDCIGYNLNGSTDWTQSWANDRPQDSDVDGNGDIYYATREDVRKFNSSGVYQWDYGFGDRSTNGRARAIGVYDNTKVFVGWDSTGTKSDRISRINNGSLDWEDTSVSQPINNTILTDSTHVYFVDDSGTFYKFTHGGSKVTSQSGYSGVEATAWDPDGYIWIAHGLTLSRVNTSGVTQDSWSLSSPVDDINDMDIGEII